MDTGRELDRSQRRSVVDNAIYVDGRRTDDPANLEETYELLRRATWHGVDRAVSARPEAIREWRGVRPARPRRRGRAAAHQRSKLERYGDTFSWCCVPPGISTSREGGVRRAARLSSVPTLWSRPARRVTDLAKVRRRLEDTPELLRQGPEAVLYAIWTRSSMSTAGRRRAGERHRRDRGSTLQRRSRRVPPDLRTDREVIEFQRTTRAAVHILAALEAGFDKYNVDVELRATSRRPGPCLRVVDRVDAFRALLQNALSVHTTLVAQQQNDEMRPLTEASLGQNEEVKRISAWAAILFAPTLVGTIYGMNFDHMPELRWQFGYPMAILAMVATGFILYLVFKKVHWL